MSRGDRQAAVGRQGARPRLEPRQQGGRAADPHVGPGRGEAPDVGTRHARMEDVAQDHDLAAGDAAARQAGAQRVEVEQRLAGMGVPAVPGVDDVSAEDVGGEIRGAAPAVTHHEHVGAECLERAHRVHERLALGHRAAGGGHVDDVRPEPLGGRLERDARARRGLVEEDRHAHPLERGPARAAVAQDDGHLVGPAHDRVEVGRREVVHVEQVAMPPGLRAGHEAIAAPDSARRSMKTPSSPPSTSSRWTRMTSSREVGTFLPTWSARTGNSR